MEYTLPKTVVLDGEEYPIRADFRVILTILELLNDPDLSNPTKAEGLIELFYVQPERIKNAKAAVEACYSFIDM